MRYITEHIWLVVWNLEHDFFFHLIMGKNHPNWLSYFSEGLKPPTRYMFNELCSDFCNKDWYLESKFQKWCFNQITVLFYIYRI
jgi:hypothetical protein